MALPQSTAERSADFLSQLFQSQLGQFLVVLAAASIGLGILTDQASFFVATIFFLVFAGVASQFKGKRQKEEGAIQSALLWIPQPHAPKGVMWIELEQWAHSHPELVRRTITREEAKAIADERGVPESMLEPLIKT